MKKKLVTVLGFVSLVLMSKSLCSAEEILQTTDFKDGISLPWFISESKDINSRSEVIDGNYVVHLDYPGENNWDVAIRHREFQIVKGHKYKVKFKVASAKNCKIYAKIGDTSQPYNEVWNNKWQNFTLTAGIPLEVSDEFIANVDCPIAEFAFWVGGKLAGSTPYDIKFMSMSLSDEEFVPTPIPISPKYDIRVNQIGYYTKGEKIAILKAENASQIDPVEWELKDDSGKTVCKGITENVKFDNASGENVYIIDFSEFGTSGKDYILSTKNARSVPFEISKDIYSQMKYDALKYFYHVRSGTEIKMPYCVEPQWERAAFHSEDTSVVISGRGYTGPSTINATGGWYDGGDNRKNMLNAGLAVWTLQNQYEFALKKGFAKDFDDKTLNIPESGNKTPDLLDEARWEMEWMLNMQIPEGYSKAGMAVHKIIDETPPIIGTTGETLKRRLYYPPSTNATLNLAACAAQAARLWKDIDKDFSDKCLLAAETAWSAAKKNPDDFSIYGPAPLGGHVEDLNDDFYWAACELYLTTKNSIYLDDMKTSTFYCTVPKTLVGNIEQVASGHFTSRMAVFGTLSLALLAEDEFPEAVDSIVDTADYFVNVRDNEGYRVTLPEKMAISTWDGGEVINGYLPFSNQMLLNNAILMAYAYDLKQDSKYLSSLRDSLDYLVGRNPNTISYVTGYGENPAKNPYHIFFAKMANPESPEVPSGFVVSGPNSKKMDNMLSSSIPTNPMHPSQKCYLDNIESWSSNSVSIDLNAALAWVTAYSDAIGDVEYAPVTTPSPITSNVADINKDGIVNMVDVMMIAKVFNLTKSDARFDQKCDLNNDDVINMADVIIVAVNFGK